MATYFVTLGSSEYKVEILNNMFKVNGRRFDMKLQQLNEHGLYLIERGKQKLEMLATPNSAEELSVSVNNRQFTVYVEREGRKNGVSKSKSTDNVLVAPLPGVVVSVRVEKGDRIEKGDVVLTLESMKMQMDIRAANTGQVVGVAKKPGDKVEKGEVLVSLG